MTDDKDYEGKSYCYLKGFVGIGSKNCTNGQVLGSDEMCPAKKRTGIIVGSVIGGFVGLAIIVAVGVIVGRALWLKRKAKKASKYSIFSETTPLSNTQDEETYVLLSVPRSQIQQQMRVYS